MDTEKKPFYKKWWSWILIFFFLPFFASYWVWKQKWNLKIKLGVLIPLWIIILIAGLANSNKNTTVQTQTSIDTASNVQQPLANPTQVITSVPTVPSQPFDSNRGNNYISAKYGQEFYDLANKAAPGYIEDIRLDLVPEDPQGKSEQEYNKSISSAFLTVVVDSSYWSSTNDTARKDFVAALTNAVKNNFSGFPHVKVNNGTRTVAEGEWSVFGGEPKITLK